MLFNGVSVHSARGQNLGANRVIPRLASLSSQIVTPLTAEEFEEAMRLQPNPHIRRSYPDPPRLPHFPLALTRWEPNPRHQYWLPLVPIDSLPAAQPPAVPRYRLPLVIGTFAVGYAGTYSALASGWYTGPREPFHWFNDLPEWKQLDKAGHFWGAFHESRGAVDMLRWAGLTPKKALWYGGFVGFLLQSPIENFDGRDPEYGASASDLAANFLGSAALIGQHLAWGEVRVMPKVSFHLTPYAARRPNVLGKSFGERLLKDYNGQTYWLCTDVGAFLPAGNRWPRWLQPALGYGAQQMVYNDAATNRAAGLDSYRQYYLSFDIDLRRIPTRSKVLRTVFYVASIVHLPAPALELNRKRGLVMHGLYY